MRISSLTIIAMLSACSAQKQFELTADESTAATQRSLSVATSPVYASDFNPVQFLCQPAQPRLEGAGDWYRPGYLDAAENRAADSRARFEQQAYRNQYLDEAVATQVGSYRLFSPAHTFAQDASDLSAAFKDELDWFASELLKGELVVDIYVLGHTNNSGNHAYNQRLSEQRAEAVTEYLASRSVPRQRLHAIGLGEIAPMKNIAPRHARQRNRRVELLSYLPLDLEYGQRSLCLRSEISGETAILSHSDKAKVKK